MQDIEKTEEFLQIHMPKILSRDPHVWVTDGSQVQRIKPKSQNVKERVMLCKRDYRSLLYWLLIRKILCKFRKYRASKAGMTERLKTQEKEKTLRKLLM